MDIFDKYPRSKFLQGLRNRPDIFNLKNRITELFSFIDGLEDSHFETELDVDPYSRIWEMLVAKTLKESGLQISSSDAGPDFILHCGSQRVCVEAICADEGIPGLPDSVPPIQYKTEAAQEVPMEKMVLRVSGALRDKRLKFEHYLKSGIISSEDICIIAISSSKFSARGANYPSLGLQATLGFGGPYVIYDRHEQDFREEGLAFRGAITKANKSNVSTTAFLDPSNSIISGLLYSDESVFSLSYPQTDVTSFIHNPTATHNLNPGTLTGVDELWTIVSSGKEVWKTFQLKSRILPNPGSNKRR